MTYAEYCALEREAEVKHEYLRGEVFAMAGGSAEHSRLAIVIAHLLSVALQGRPCRIFSSDLRVRVEATDFDSYPDLSIVCGAPEFCKADAYALINPLVLVEVLSPSTEGYDRGQKAAHYRRIPSLRAYLLVGQTERRLELQVRQGDGGWALFEAGPGERLRIPPLDIELDVDAVYRHALAPD